MELSQEDFGSKIGLSGRYIQKIEKGDAEVNIKTLSKIEKYLSSIGKKLNFNEINQIGNYNNQASGGGSIIIGDGGKKNKEKVKELESEVKNLEGKIKDLERIIEEKDNTISTLKDMIELLKNQIK